MDFSCLAETTETFFWSLCMMPFNVYFILKKSGVFPLEWACGNNHTEI